MSEVPLYSLPQSRAKASCASRGQGSHTGRRWSLNPSGKCLYERPTRGTVCGTMRSMFGVDAGCLAIHYQSLLVHPLGETFAAPPPPLVTWGCPWIYLSSARIESQLGGSGLPETLSPTSRRRTPFLESIAPCTSRTPFLGSFRLRKGLPAPLHQQLRLLLVRR